MWCRAWWWIMCMMGGGWLWEGFPSQIQPPPQVLSSHNYPSPAIILCDHYLTPSRLHLQLWLKTMSAFSMQASSALPFAKVLKAPPSYQFRFDQMSTDIPSQALFDHGKLAWPNVSHELLALRSPLTKCWSLLTGIHIKAGAFSH